MSKYNYNPERLTRKVFDRTLDRLTNKYKRYAERVLELERKLKTLEEFLDQGPHGSAYKLFLESKK